MSYDQRIKDGFMIHDLCIDDPIPPEMNHIDTLHPTEIPYRLLNHFPEKIIRDEIKKKEIILERRRLKHSRVKGGAE